MKTNGTTSKSSSVSTVLHYVRDIPAQLESGLETHPFATVAAIAGTSFVGGMVFGSRLARAVLVAVAPAIVHRLLEGPLGDELVGSIRAAFRSQPLKSKTAS